MYKKNTSRKYERTSRGDGGLRHPAFKLFLILNIAAFGYAVHLYFKQKEPITPIGTQAVESPSDSFRIVATETPKQANNHKLVIEKPDGKQSIASAPVIKSIPVPLAPVEKKDTVEFAKTEKLPAPSSEKKATELQVPVSVSPDDISMNAPFADEYNEWLKQPVNDNKAVAFTITRGQVHFHDKPDESTRRTAFINHWNRAILIPIQEKNGFVYIVYTNHNGQTSKGWLPKKQLKPLY